MTLRFTVEAQDTGTAARAGTISSDRGTLRTPAFMPVGTGATVKGVWPDQLREMGYDCILANTYHLYLRPGHERIRGQGGLHRRFRRQPVPFRVDRIRLDLLRADR